MPVFNYCDFGNPENVGYNPHSSKCLYCSSNLEQFDIEDTWRTDYKLIDKIHKRTTKEYKKINGLEDIYLNLDFERQSTEVWGSICQTCGWWRIVKDVSISAEVWQIWQIFFGVSGNLKNLDLSNINSEIDEVCNYLIARYEARFSMHPKLFEDVTANVFKNVGYQTLITGYSNDGGIDIVLEKDSKQIGVQVKRYKNRIKVEQIRAFTGALLLSEYRYGIFVATSDFQNGAYKAAENFSRKGTHIELVNGKDFYGALKFSCKTSFDIPSLKKKIEDAGITQLYSYNWETPMNSL